MFTDPSGLFEVGFAVSLTIAGLLAYIGALQVVEFSALAFPMAAATAALAVGEILQTVAYAYYDYSTCGAFAWLQRAFEIASVILTRIVIAMALDAGMKAVVSAYAGPAGVGSVLAKQIFLGVPLIFALRFSLSLLSIMIRASIHGFFADSVQRTCCGKREEFSF